MDKNKFSKKDKNKENKKTSNASRIDADFRIKIEEAIKAFLNNDDQMVYEFPATLSNAERAFVHKLAPKYSLRTKSDGRADNRRLSLYKLTENGQFMNSSVEIKVNEETVTIMENLTREFTFSKENCVASRPEIVRNKSKSFILSKPPSLVPLSEEITSALKKTRESLPIFPYRDEILKAIGSNRIVLIEGSTGSGKTTQIPQYILEHAKDNSQPCRILCTQPRRISAIASAERVSYERKQSCGKTVGFQIRLESNISQDTNCIFLTPGVFCRYLMYDNPHSLFNNITHVIIDEAHERAKENDFLLTSIKENFHLNPNLKLIIMSATMDTEVFEDYFGDCRKISIFVQQFLVKEVYLEDILKQVKFSHPKVDELNEKLRSGQPIEVSRSAYVNCDDVIQEVLDDDDVNFLNEVLDDLIESEDIESGIDQFKHLIQNETEVDGAILVFLPGYDDILQQANLINQRLSKPFELFMLHSSMKTEDQKKVLKPVDKWKRKIILSTNIAESSITINDVVFVIDSGREKQKSYDAISHSSSLSVQWISKASANQRKGRAGRVHEGIVFRMYSIDRFNSMLDSTIPQLLRTSLTEICLQSKLIINNTMSIEEFLLKCIATPSVLSIRQSIKLLKCLGALDENENLTILGSYLAEMPIDARYGKMIIYSIVLRYLDPVLDVVAVMSSGDQLFVLPTRADERIKCDQVKRNYGGNSLSDHFMMAKIFLNFYLLRSKNQNTRRFCQDNFINPICSQIYSHLKAAGLINSNQHWLNGNSQKWPVIRSCLCAGLYPNVARIDRQRKMMYSDIDKKLVFHMSSTLTTRGNRAMDFLKTLPSDWVVFEEKNRIGRIAMIRNNTIINSFHLLFTAGASLTTAIESNGWEEESNHESFLIKIDNLVSFSMDVKVGKLLLEMRERLDDLVLRILTERNFNCQNADKKLIAMITKILVTEENHSGFPPCEFHVDSPEEIEKKGNQPSWRSNQAANNNSSTKRTTFYNENVAGPSRRNNQTSRTSFPSTSSNNKKGNIATGRSNNNNFNSLSKPHPRFQIPNKCQIFFILEVNDYEKLRDLASRLMFDVELLELNPWLKEELYQPKMGTLQIFIIFYSSLRTEFLGYGDVMPSNGDNPLQFHFRLFRSLPLHRMNNRQNHYLNHEFKTIFLRDIRGVLDYYRCGELPFDVGSYIIRALQG
ncbi:CLUMA_CG007619, isoform A [Clunio marinus]|uniref:CLUMA_CG007619, isoform A n=1 Tax=Clunio marinus TaxID=568069 RepID=A0A1J1I185_9DIPT|nr:CLUMA_CG007619, isoform A [Clunio marinus]